MQILLEDYLKILVAILFDDRGYLMRIIINELEISTCLPPKLKSDDNVYDREERLNTLHVMSCVLLLREVYLLHIQSALQ